jgi:hypothetical protein
MGPAMVVLVGGGLVHLVRHDDGMPGAVHHRPDEEVEARQETLEVPMCPVRTGAVAGESLVFLGRMIFTYCYPQNIGTLSRPNCASSNHGKSVFLFSLNYLPYYHYHIY